MKMRHHLALWLTLVLATVALLNCTQLGAGEFAKNPPGTPSEKNKEQAARQEVYDRMDVIFEQLLHARHLAAILLNRPKADEIQTGPSCRVHYAYVADPKPGVDPFLVADYKDCTFQIKQKGVVYEVIFSGKENFLAGSDGRTLSATSSNLSMRVRNKGGTRRPTRTFRLQRDLSLSTTNLLENPQDTASTIPFTQVNTFEPAFESDRGRLPAWTEKTEGSLLAQRPATVQAGAPIRITGMETGAVMQLDYEIPRGKNGKNKVESLHGTLEMTATTALEFVSGCSFPKGRFKWARDEDEQVKASGEFELDENGLREVPTELSGASAPDLTPPWGKCAPK